MNMDNWWVFGSLSFLTVAGKNLIGWWDYGSAITVASGETFTVDFGATVLTIT